MTTTQRVVHCSQNFTSSGDGYNYCNIQMNKTGDSDVVWERRS